MNIDNIPNFCIEDYEYDYSFGHRTILPDSDEILDLAIKKAYAYSELLNGNMRAEVPTSTSMASIILENIKQGTSTTRYMSMVNQISVTDKGNVLIGKKVIKHRKFFETFIGYVPEELDSTTTGRMIISADPNDFMKCSHRDYVTWGSCFRPGGEYSHTTVAFATAPNVLMALIENESGTKIIGRKFVLVFDNFILFLKKYGTFPIEYQKDLSRFIVQKLWNKSKSQTTIVSDADALMDVTKKISAFTDNGYWKKLQGISFNKYDSHYVDPCYFAVYPKDAGTSLLNMVSNTDYKLDLPIYLKDGRDDIQCDGCGEYFDSSSYVYTDITGNYHYCSEDCREDQCVWSNIESGYVRRVDTTRIRILDRDFDYIRDNNHCFDEYTTKIYTIDSSGTIRYIRLMRDAVDQLIGIVKSDIIDAISEEPYFANHVKDRDCGELLYIYESIDDYDMRQNANYDALLTMAVNAMRKYYETQGRIANALYQESLTLA